MAGSYELNAFVAKSYDLWHNGCEADLHVRCFNGYSYVNLQAGLGYARSKEKIKSQDMKNAKWIKKRKQSSTMEEVVINRRDNIVVTEFSGKIQDGQTQPLINVNKDHDDERNVHSLRSRIRFNSPSFLRLQQSSRGWSRPSTWAHTAPPGYRS